MKCPAGCKNGKMSRWAPDDGHGGLLGGVTYWYDCKRCDGAGIVDEPAPSLGLDALTKDKRHLLVEDDLGWF